MALGYGVGQEDIPLQVAVGLPVDWNGYSCYIRKLIKALSQDSTRKRTALTLLSVYLCLANPPSCELCYSIHLGYYQVFLSWDHSLLL